MDELRSEVAVTARRCVQAGLIAAFGHVSARAGDRVVITGTQPLADTAAADTIVLTADGEVVTGPAATLPLEAALHLAIYRARPDVGAVCRGHPPAAVRWGTGLAALPLTHGLGALAGRVVRVHPEVELVVDRARGDAVARTLGQDAAVLLRGNGALAVGTTPTEAAVRLWYLEERAEVAAASGGRGPDPSPIWTARLTHTPAELHRAMRWFEATFDATGASA